MSNNEDWEISYNLLQLLLVVISCCFEIRDKNMSEKILIIGKGQQPASMEGFTQVKMVVNGSQNQFSFEMVQQLLTLQSQFAMKIEFLQLQGNTLDQERMMLAFHFGLLLKDKSNEITYFSNDPALDNLVAQAKNQGLNLKRISG